MSLIHNASLEAHHEGVFGETSASETKGLRLNKSAKGSVSGRPSRPFADD